MERSQNGEVWWAEKGVRAGKPRRGSKETPRNTLVVGRASDKRKKEMALGLNGRVKVEVSEGHRNYFSRMVNMKS